ncbi:MAG TPA: heme-binding beta-barrel domain-containing protein [Bdellovibrionales bacterium]|nr:heme-binding beta-barrel domain-containing protein [Bdellovibrionales bacterium]
MNDQLREQLGPLAALVGVWEGDKGDDIAPSDSRGVERNSYRERITFEQVGPVQNHEQSLNVLRYSTKATRLGETDSFHEELGYWSWEPRTQEVMRSFLIPRGIALIAGGKAEMDARQFRLIATSGSCTFGICVNPFLDREFKILSYTLDLKVLDENTFAYEEDTVLQIQGQKEPFHHRDKNTLKRVL